jgi:hypothetical protein
MLMNLLNAAASVALLMQTSLSNAAQLPDGVIVCKGERTEEGYPYGVQERGSEYHLLQLSQGKLFKREGLLASEFCMDIDRKCSTLTKGTKLKLSMSDFVNHAPGYTESFELDRRTGHFIWSGGGLDGGWRLVGLCHRVE